MDLCNLKFVYLINLVTPFIGFSVEFYLIIT